MPTKPDAKAAAPVKEAPKFDMKTAVSPAQMERTGGEQAARMLNSLKEKEAALVEKLERLKKLSPQDVAVITARTQATLDSVREQIKSYA